VELYGHLQVEARRALYLVKGVDTVCVVGAGEGGFVKLAQIAASTLPTAAMARTPPFADVLARVLGTRLGRSDPGCWDPAQTTLSLPFKMLLFVAIDGWGLLAQSPVTGYRS
jgi:hypothetical protein